MPLALALGKPLVEKPLEEKASRYAIRQSYRIHAEF
jgi:hypothetical protein